MAKIDVEKIVLERMYRLSELAEEEFGKLPKRSKRYIELVNKLSQRNRVKIPKELRMKFCKKCSAFLVEGKNLERKVSGKLIETKCLECKAVTKAKA